MLRQVDDYHKKTHKAEGRFFSCMCIQLIKDPIEMLQGCKRKVMIERKGNVKSEFLVGKID